MKLSFLLFLLFSITNVSAQEVVTLVNKDSIYNSVEIERRPEYPGGMEAFYKHISANFNIPKDKGFAGGKVILSFVIEKDGSLVDIKILRDAGFGTGDEAVRVLRKSKNWIPAEQKGIKVRCKYMLPIALRQR